ncbi:delta-class carbonic anhydrase [Cribrihabitans neustonicus]|uniref:delta-class carbonic anhydrase n=1 Tax=Cribrihabitans neustonicus TaxID=1429085 RepID=UPI003B5A9CFE
MFKPLPALTIAALFSFAQTSAVLAVDGSAGHVPDNVIAAQRAKLAESTAGAVFGPQSPRDIDAAAGTNPRHFSTAPEYTRMNLCNIHFHESAEHRGGEFTRYAGNGDGKGYGTGYLYDGELSAAERAPLDHPIGTGKHGGLEPGDTIELHYVHTTAQVEPGPTLGACLSDAVMNPQLRVEAQVFVLVNDESALDFSHLTALGKRSVLHQALNIPSNTGTPVVYAGSTTGPSYNEAGSPLEVTWSVRPKVARVNIHSVGRWLDSNVFEEDHAHGVRNLVLNPALLSEITR